ncbi:MAG: hypothetical protein WBF21_02305 [Steroidobacteraceae bacterium]|jgi:hypothetical protein
MKFVRGVTGPKKQPPKPAKDDPPARRSTPWHAVSIVAKSTSCEAARALRAARFLSATAPRLPLPGCTMGNSCPCAYKHHADRRGQPRRKDELVGMKRNIKGMQERRVRSSRRSTD